MYICHDADKVIAYHEKKEVVETYVESIYHYHKFRLDIRKATKEEKNMLNKTYDLYLVRFGQTYVQSGYTGYLQIHTESYIEDEKFAKDILYRLLETRGLKGKQYKKVKGAVKVLEKLIYEDETYTPSLKELTNLKFDYDPYLYNMGVYF